MAEKVTEKKSYRMFGLNKANPDRLLFKKLTYLKEEANAVVLVSPDKKTFLTTKDLVGKSPKTIVQDAIMMKVMSVLNAKLTNKNGIPLKSQFSKNI